MELSYHIWDGTGHSHSTPTARRIALLHGMGGTGALWRPVAASLEEEFAVLAPDQRGHGKSQIPFTPGSRSLPSYTPLDYGRDVLETFQALNFYPSWILGHSMGVRSAVAAAHLKPEWTQGLILVDLGFSGVAGGGLGNNLAEFLKILPSQFTSRDEAKVFMSAHCPDPSIAQYLLAVSFRDANGNLSFPFDRSALIQTIEAARDASVRTWIKELASQGMPILILRGAKSLVWSHEDFEAEREALKNEKSVEFTEVEGAGHGLPFEQRPLFVSLVREFIHHHDLR